MVLARALGGPVQRNAEDTRLSVKADSAEAANRAVAALIAEGIEVADFSLGSPSLEEVFFALTGRTETEEART